MDKKRFDIIVVGGGALGTFHAYHALLKGKKVLLLEKDKRAQEATVRNFGQVVPSGLPPGDWHEFGRYTTALYKEIQGQYDIGIRSNGSCYIASDEAEMAVLEEMKGRFAATGYDGELWNREKVLERYPTVREDYAKGALFFPQEVSAEPELMIHRIGEYMRQRFREQLTMKYHCPVLHIEAGHDTCRVHAADGEVYTSGHVFVCNGRDVKLLFPEVFASSGLIVSKLNMMATAPLPGVALPGNILTGLTIRRYESFRTCDAYKDLDPACVAEDTKHWGIHILFKQRKDGSIIIGDSHEYAPVCDQDDLGVFMNDLQISDVILREARAILDLPQWTIAQHWTGFYAQHPDEIYTHTISGRIHIATGIGGKGMTTGAGFSRHHVERVLG